MSTPHALPHATPSPLWRLLLLIGATSFGCSGAAPDADTASAPTVASRATASTTPDASADSIASTLSSGSSSSNPCAGNSVFCDDYLNPSRASAYTTLHGSWIRSTGKYQSLDSVAWQRARSTLASLATDFDVTISGHSLGDSGFGLVFDASADADDGHAVIVHPAQFQGVFLKELQPGASDIDLASYHLPASMRGQPLTLRVRRSGEQVIVWLNGELVLSASDQAPGAHGRVGLLTSTTNLTAAAGADFTMLRVDSLTEWSPTPDAGNWSFVPTTTVAAETANNTAASTLFRDDYKNYEDFAQSTNSNGDLVTGATAATDLSRGRVSKVPVSTLAPEGATTQMFVETQTWFCHLASNEQADADGGRGLVPDARCSSHIDVGYNSDDPAHVALQVSDLMSRGFAGVIMDWSGRDNPSPTYPTTTSPSTATAQSSTVVSTNAIYAFKAEAEAQPAGKFLFSVVEDEAITNCRNGWAGGCACWPAYSSTCDETTQVISDLNYISDHWATSPDYLQIDGGPAVFFFAPDYNACPKPDAGDCQHIDWAAVERYTPSNQRWIFEGTSGFGDANSTGAFDWVKPGAYPAGNTTFGLDGIDSFDEYVINHPDHAAVVDSVFKGFDDAVTNGWSYSTTANNTRYINQRCGQTWLDSFSEHWSRFDGAGLPSLEAIQVVTWDDYEEATEIETGIDTCLETLTLSLNNNVLTWTTSYGTSLTDSSIRGSENTVDHFEVFVSEDGEKLMPLGGPLGSSPLPHSLDLASFNLPSGHYSLFVEAVGKPSLTSLISTGFSYTAP